MQSDYEAKKDFRPPSLGVCHPQINAILSSFFMVPLWLNLQPERIVMILSFPVSEAPSNAVPLLWSADLPGIIPAVENQEEKQG